MKVQIDESICLQKGLSLNEVMIALTVKTGKFKENIDSMVTRGILLDHNGHYTLNPEWEKVVDEILKASVGNVPSNERLLKLAAKMRACFPEGKMPGTAYYYRCNNGEVTKKMQKFFAQYGDYSDEEVVDACKRFVASFNGNFRYLPLIKYFIFKFKDEKDEDGNVHRVEHSPLADYLENKEEEGVVIDNSDDWMMNARN